MRIHFPLRIATMYELAIVVGLVLLVLSLARRRPDRSRVAEDLPRHPAPPPLPPGRLRERPAVSAGQLFFAILFSPFVFAWWILASLGDFVSIPVHLAVGTATAAVSLLFSLVGAQPRRLWRVAVRQFSRAGSAAFGSFLRLVSAFGLGGVVDRVREDAREEPEERLAHLRESGISPRTYPFEDRYRIESTLGAGGSTARLFVVRRLHAHRPVGDRLVLKYFDMGLGSRLEEVIRESRGMQIAKEMGIVVDHHLAEDHFYYVMPYYEGETLTRAAARIHRTLGAKDEMPADALRTCLGWVAELLRILDGYHRHGVIHKDVKPDNVIVTDRGIQLVDLGLLTPLTSAMTLTTHGTEYFRDPEMVKLAVAGKRVRDVDAVRFDVYSSGALLYYLLEGSFPACGPLSRFGRPVPMALSVIVSRAMAEGDKRYPGIAALRADLEAASRALDAGSLASLPVSRLPSMGGEPADLSAPPLPPPPIPFARGDAAPPRRRGPFRAISRVLLLGLLAAGAWSIFVAVLEPTPGRPATEVLSGHAELLTGERVAAEIERWRAAAQRVHDLAATGLSLDGVPLLVVADETLALRGIVGEVRAALAAKSIPWHPSETLARQVRAILDAREGSEEEIARRIAGAAAPDEPPMVLSIADLGYGEPGGRRRAALTFRYRTFVESRTLDVPAAGSGG